MDQNIYVNALVKHLEDNNMPMSANIVRGLYNDLVALTEQVNKSKQNFMLYCETCSGSGNIDESLGGVPIEYRTNICPDCDGRGYHWHMVITE